MSATSLAEAVVSGVLTGGATAATTIWGFFKTTKERLEKLEAAVGKTDPRSGLMLAVQLVNEAVSRLQDRIERFEDRLKKQEDWGNVGIIRTPMPFDPHLVNPEADGRIRDALRRVGDLEDNVKRLERRIESWSGDLDKLDERRAQELGKLREEMASINGLLRGLMAAMDFDNHR
jgi:predicted  nucleic acid-binding Zn-ribbon protein